MNITHEFEQQKKYYMDNPYPSLEQRVEILLAIKSLLQHQANAFVSAVNQDFSHRSRQETLFLEISPSLNALTYCLKHLKKWMALKKRHVSWYLKPATAKVIAQPLGVVGIIVPWNYPVYLAIVPIIYALAAGNQVMVKCSELTPATGQLLATLFSQWQFKQRVCIINGDVAIAEAFSRLPFGHLLFTGSTAIGKAVMANASTHLTSLTLELGGKSPVIVSKTMNERYLERLFMGKLFNAGQTCIAPDYVLIPKGQEVDLEVLFKRFMDKHYPDVIHNDNYSSIISDHHKQRLQALLADALEKGARVVRFGDDDNASRKLPIYLLFDVHQGMRVMQEEIFGPLLPVISYDKFNDALAIIHLNPTPLALYYFGDDVSEINQLTYHTLSGALTINDTIMHIAIDDLPFGGVGQSGMGHYHGHEGFLTFSKLKPVFAQKRISTARWFYPPYGKLVDNFLRYFAGIRF